jgi:hypothetical protein
LLPGDAPSASVDAVLPAAADSIGTPQLDRKRPSTGPQASGSSGSGSSDGTSPSGSSSPTPGSADVRCALEHNCVRWGRHELPPQAGIGVYERGPDGLLTAVRVYDDIEAPVEHA